MRSPRWKDRYCRSDRRSATSGCSRTTSRACAPMRCRTPRRACCRAATPSSCSTRQNGSFSFPGRISGSASGRPGVARRAPRRGRDPRNVETGAAHRADRRLGTPVARDMRRDRDRSRRPASSGRRPANRGGLGLVRRRHLTARTQVAVAPWMTFSITGSSGAGGSRCSGASSTCHGPMTRSTAAAGTT